MTRYERRSCSRRRLRSLIGRGQVVDAVRIASAAAHLRTVIGGALPDFIDDIGALMATARADLGDPAFDAAWAAGEALDRDEALRDALAILAGDPTHDDRPGGG